MSKILSPLLQKQSHQSPEEPLTVCPGSQYVRLGPGKPAPFPWCDRVFPRDLSLLYPYCSGTKVWRLGGFQLSAAPSNLYLPQPCSPNSTVEGEGGRSSHQWWHLGHICPAETCSWQLCWFQGGFFCFFTWCKRRRLIAMTHSLFLRLLRQSYFSQLQSQVILNNSPAALAHTNVIRPLASWPYCFILPFRQ